MRCFDEQIAVGNEGLAHWHRSCDQGWKTLFNLTRILDNDHYFDVMSASQTDSDSNLQPRAHVFHRKDSRLTRVISKIVR